MEWSVVDIGCNVRRYCFGSLQIALLIAVHTLLVPCSSSFVAPLACTASSPDCNCEAIDSCTCNLQFGRCVCRDEVAALLRDGSCIATSSARRVQEGHHGGNCTQDDLEVFVVLVVGTTPSPEVQTPSLRRGQPSLALISILHWSAAAALATPPERIGVFGAKLVADVAEDNASQLEGRPSLLFFDVSFTICASTSDELVPGGVFEKRFIQSWQTFAAFPLTTVRVLELKRSSQETIVDARNQPPYLPPPGTHTIENAEESPAPQWKDFFWLFPAGGLAVVLLFVTIWRLLHLKCSKKATCDSPRNWREVAPGAQLQRHPFEMQTMPEGPGGGTLASVAYDFNPNSDDGSVFAASAGLEASECLTICKDDFLEVFAQGDGWLYGRRSADGLFGYVPEQCVCWILGEHGAPSPPIVVATSTGRVSAAEVTPSPQ